MLGTVLCSTAATCCEELHVQVAANVGTERLHRPVLLGPSGKPIVKMFVFAPSEFYDFVSQVLRAPAYWPSTHLVTRNVESACSLHKSRVSSDEQEPVSASTLSGRSGSAGAEKVFAWLLHSDTRPHILMALSLTRTRIQEQSSRVGVP
jgi:hypothetical protein